MVHVAGMPLAVLLQRPGGGRAVLRLPILTLCDFRIFHVEFSDVQCSRWLRNVEEWLRLEPNLSGLRGSGPCPARPGGSFGGGAGALWELCSESSLSADARLPGRCLCWQQHRAHGSGVASGAEGGHVRGKGAFCIFVQQAVHGSMRQALPEPRPNDAMLPAASGTS